MSATKIVPHDDECNGGKEEKCPYAEAGRTYLGKTTFHSLPWLTENICVHIKVRRKRSFPI